MKNLLIIFILISNSTLCQQIHSISESSSHHISGSYLVNDTLNVNFVSNINHQHFTGSEDFKKQRFVHNNGIVSLNNQIIDTNFLSYKTKRINLGNGDFFEVGDKHDSSLSQSAHLWIKNSLIHNDSIVSNPFIDSNFNSFFVLDAQRVNSSVFVFGGYSIQNYPFRKSFILKYNTLNNQYTSNSFFCFSAFCFINSAIYDSIRKEFVVVSVFRIGDTIPPNGVGIAKIDTNLNLVPNTSHTMDVNYNPWFGRPKYTYDYAADIAWVSDTTFLTAGTVMNYQQLPSQNSNPNPDYWDDVAVSLRSSTTLREISSTKVYGKVDTAESQEPGNFILEKVDSNLFVAVTNSRHYNYTPEPWNTSLALFGLDTAGNKHWEYYLPYNDYCWAKNAHPTSDGGLWVSIQCSGNLDLQAGTYDYFGKVAYIDSIAHWLRIGTVGEREIKKEARDFVVYPNPTKDYLKVKQYGLITALNYEVYDQSGRLLQSKESAEHQVEMNIQDLAKGFYILRISNKNGALIKTEKIVKH